MDNYRQLVREILMEGEKHEDRTSVGTLSLFGRMLKYDLRHAFPLTTMKKVPYRWVAEELFWILRGDTSSKALEAKGVDIWKEWAGEDGDLGPTYGFQLRSFGAMYLGASMCPVSGGFDQVKWLCQELSLNPGSRRLILTYWDPKTMAINGDVFPPCHVASQFKVAGGRLNCMLFQRSADAFLGLPFDIASYATLVHLLAAVTRLEPGELTIAIGDAHLYLNHLDQAREMVTRIPRALPQLLVLDPMRKIYGNGFEGLMSASWDNLELMGYGPHGKISADVAV